MVQPIYGKLSIGTDMTEFESQLDATKIALTRTLTQIALTPVSAKSVDHVIYITGNSLIK